MLATTEILEAVLLQLPLREILHANAVCRRWRDVIAASPTLQQALFLAPDPAASARDREPEKNPLLEALFRELFQSGLSFNRWDALEIKWFQRMAWFADEARRRAVLRADASWRRMYPVQPPARIDSVVANGWCCTLEEDVTLGEISARFEHLQEGGARMGLIYDILVQLPDNHDDSGVFIEWHMFPMDDDLETKSRRDGVRMESVERSRLEEELCLTNKITLYQAYNLPCALQNGRMVSGLRIVDCDPKLLQRTHDEENQWASNLEL